MRKLIAALLLTLVAPIAQASLLDFSFSYEDANSGNVVTGIVRGLADNASGAASSVEVFSNTGGFGIGEYIGDPLANLFRVFNGQLEDADFLSHGHVNNSAVMDSSFRFVVVNPVFCVVQPCPQTILGGLTHSPTSSVVYVDSVVAFVPAAPVPLPASLALVGLGLVLLRLPASYQRPDCRE